MAATFKNFATTKLTQNLSASATTAYVSSADAAKLPIADGVDSWFYLVIQRATDSSYFEIVKVTNKVDGTLTIVREQEGTIAKAFLLNDLAEARLTTMGLLDAFIGKSDWRLWAVTEAQFEAIRAQNKEKYAASGFVHFGKHVESAKVNNGLWVDQQVASANKMYLGRGIDLISGNSKTNFPLLNIAGVTTSVDSITTALGWQVDIKFPQAPDGKTTYNKSTGGITNHATVTDAFNAQAADPTNVEVVTDRVDMWGFEAWLEEVNTTNPYVYPNGLIQSQAETMEGIDTSASARPVTYYAVFDGDTGSKGKGLNFFALTDVQKKKVLGNAKNNLYYLDDGRLVQWRLRQRTIAGAGNGDWLNVSSVIDADLLFSQASGVNSQGMRDSLGNTGFVGNVNEWNPVSELYGIFPAISGKGQLDASAGVNGECYFLVCGTVNRLNQGAYHPSFNPSGAGSFIIGNGSIPTVWSGDVLNVPTSTLHCFIKPTSPYPYTDGYQYPTSSNGANVGSISGAGSGRPYGRFYDAIYADGQGGVCRDMRYSAYGVDTVDFAEADQKVKNGTYRGFEKLRHTKVIAFTCSTTEVGQDWGRIPMTHAEALRVAGLLQITQDVQFANQNMAVSLYNPTKGLVIHAASLILAEGNAHFGGYLDPQNSLAIWLGFDPSVVESHINGFERLGLASGTIEAVTSTFCSNGQTLYAIATELKTTSVGGSFLQTDVIGNPANILANPALANGWQGSWLPWIPNNTASPSQVRKALKDMGQVYSVNNGASWTYSTWSLDEATNSESSGGAIPANTVLIRYYQAFAKQTEPAVNAAIYGKDSGIGRVIASSSNSTDYSVFLGESLCGVICKNDGVAQAGLFTVNSINIDQFGKISSKAWNTANTHVPLTLGAPVNNSPAFKALNYDVNINQQASIQYAYTELKHNGTNWGDDGKVTIVDNQSTKLDTNGNTVLIGTARLKEPLGWVYNNV